MVTTPGKPTPLTLTLPLTVLVEPTPELTPAPTPGLGPDTAAHFGLRILVLTLVQGSGWAYEVVVEKQISEPRQPRQRCRYGT